MLHKLFITNNNSHNKVMVKNWALLVAFIFLLSSLAQAKE
jgi:hypothetical protein